MSRDKLISAKAMKEENLNQRVERSDKASIPNHLVSDCQDTFNMCLSILEAKNADYAKHYAQINYTVKSFSIQFFTFV